MSHLDYVMKVFHPFLIQHKGKLDWYVLFRLSDGYIFHDNALLSIYYNSMINLFIDQYKAGHTCVLYTVKL